jgi:heavy metal sensor kinase
MFSRFSIRFRLTLWYSFSLALLLGFLAIASYFAMRASMYRSVDVDLRYRLSGVEEFIEAQPSADLNELPGAIAHQSTLGVLFQIFDDTGTLIYQSDPLATHRIHIAAPSPVGATILYREISQGWPVRLASQRISFRGRTVIVEAAQPLRFHYASFREFATGLLISLPLLVGIATTVGYWMSGRALAPVEQIVQDVRAIDSNRLTSRLSVPPAQDELRRLSETLNLMLDRIQASVTRIRQFTADASHELRAPLTLIQTAAEYTLRRERSQKELVDAMETILRESKRTSQLIDNLLLLARADSDDEVLTSGSVPIIPALLDALDRCRPMAAGKNIELITHLPEAPIEVCGDLTLLQRLFFVLLENAIKYTPENGHVSVALKSDSNCAVIEVADTGIGISQEDLPHVFDRFWRADKVRSRATGGTGLGLSIAKWIVERTGGTLRAESIVGQGSKFEVRIPRLNLVEGRTT